MAADVPKILEHEWIVIFNALYNQVGINTILSAYKKVSYGRQNFDFPNPAVYCQNLDCNWVVKSFSLSGKFF